MKIIIDRVHYAELRNDEFPIVYEQTLGICAKHNPVYLRLEKSYGELASFSEPFRALTVYMRKNEKLTQAGKLDVERDMLVTSIGRVVKGFGHIALPDTVAHVELLDALIEKHKFRTIAVSSRAAETERLLMFEADIVAGGQTVQEALSAFGLTAAIARLFAVNREYDTLFREYIAGKSEEQRIDVASLRKGCSKAIAQFFDAVQYSAYLYEDLDYTPLANELNLLNRYYNQQLKARTARRKNGKKTDAEPPIQPLENA